MAQPSTNQGNSQTIALLDPSQVATPAVPTTTPAAPAASSLIRIASRTTSGARGPRAMHRRGRTSTHRPDSTRRLERIRQQGRRTRRFFAHCVALDPTMSSRQRQTSRDRLQARQRHQQRQARHLRQLPELRPQRQRLQRQRRHPQSLRPQARTCHRFSGEVPR